MGTLAVLSLSDSRTSHRVSDFRHSHISLIGLCTAMYGKFGTGQRGSMFGLEDEILAEALRDYSEGKLRIPIRAANASVNKEVDKQNLILLKQALQEHDKNKFQLMQAITQNQSVPAEAKKAMIDSLRSQDMMMRRLIREFGISDTPDEYVPEVKFPGEGATNAAQAEASNNGRANAGILRMAPALQKPGPSVPAGNLGGMESAGGGFTGTPPNQ